MGAGAKGEEERSWKEEQNVRQQKKTQRKTERVELEIKKYLFNSVFVSGIYVSVWTVL